MDNKGSKLTVVCDDDDREERALMLTEQTRWRSVIVQGKTIANTRAGQKLLLLTERVEGKVGRRQESHVVADETLRQVKE